MAAGDRLSDYDMDTPKLGLLDSTISGDFVYILTATHIHKFKANEELVDGTSVPVSEESDFATTPRKITSDNTHLYIGYSGATTANVTVAELEKRPLSDITKVTWKNRLAAQQSTWSGFTSQFNMKFLPIRGIATSSGTDFVVVYWVGDKRAPTTLLTNTLYNKDTGTQYLGGNDRLPHTAEFNVPKIAVTLDGSTLLTARGSRFNPTADVQSINWKSLNRRSGIQPRNLAEITSEAAVPRAILSFLKGRFQGMMSKNGVSWISVPADGGKWKLIAFQSALTGTPDAPFKPVTPEPPAPPIPTVVNRFDRAPQYDITYTDLGDQRNLITDITITEGLAWILTSETAAAHLYRRALDTSPLAAKTFLLTKGIGAARRITRDATHLYIGYTQFNNKNFAQTNRIEQRLIRDPNSVVNTWTVELSATKEWNTITPTLVPLPYHGIASEQRGVSTDKVWVSCYTYATHRTENTAAQEVANVAIQKADGAQDTSIPPTTLSANWYPSLGHDIDDDVYYVIYHRSDGQDFIFNDFTETAGAFPVDLWRRASIFRPTNTGVPALTTTSVGFAAWEGYGWWAQASAKEVKLISFLLRNQQPGTGDAGTTGRAISPITPSPFQPPPANLRWSTGAVDSKFT